MVIKKYVGKIKREMQIYRLIKEYIKEYGNTIFTKNLNLFSDKIEKLENKK